MRLSGGATLTRLNTLIAYGSPHGAITVPAAGAGNQGRVDPSMVEALCHGRGACPGLRIPAARGRGGAPFGA
ncbi:hypothetical protein GCM10023191_073250 [Actinoallomurus oryzae]|uniref:Uncharacterized protein n=1 Tax=Actinoallomurus oryzae TaxID=502180 RepID=A0ABP8QUK3_9ACTN